MLSVEKSKLLAIKRQIALFNKDFKMVKKIEEIKHDDEITKEILDYKMVEVK